MSRDDSDPVLSAARAELQAMETIAQTMDALPETVRHRIAHWVYGAYRRRKDAGRGK